MRRGVLAAFLAVLLVLSASPVAAHGNHVEADSQYSADGTVVVEAVRPLTDGFLVLHREDPDGDFGEPIGHTRVSFDDDFQRSVPVQMDEDAWADWPDNDRLWIVFHADADGDGEFTPGQDPATEVGFGTVTGRTVTLAKTDKPARVLAERSEPQRTESATATVSEVALPEDGHLVLRTGDDERAPVVGSTSLDAGVHQNVTLSFAESAFPENRSTVGLYAQLYTDDGDGEFTSDDEMVRAGDQSVDSYFLVWQVDDAGNTTSEPVVQTPTNDDVVTPTTAEPMQSSDETSDDTDSSVPGFGFVHASLAVLVAAVLLARYE